MADIVLLVRHAHAGEREDWQGDDFKRPLSRKGISQSEALSWTLRSYSPEILLSSPATRCVQTLGPTAEAMGQPISLNPDLAEGASDRAAELIAAHAGVAVFCTHGDVIPEVLAAFSAHGSLVLPPVIRCAKASIWVLRRQQQGWVDGEYLEAPEI